MHLTEQTTVSFSVINACYFLAVHIFMLSTYTCCQGSNYNFDGTSIYLTKDILSDRNQPSQTCIVIFLRMQEPVTLFVRRNIKYPLVQLDT